MNHEDRFYCADCRQPVEYLAEIDVYSCGGCERVQMRDELITERDLLRIHLTSLLEEERK